MFEREELGTDVVGVGLILVGVFAIGYNLFLGNFDAILWFCYLSLIITGFGIVAENGDVIVTQLNILTIPALIWTVDFAFMLAGHSPFGITTYFWGEGLIAKIISLQHLVTVPLAFYCLSIVKFGKTGMWKFSFLQAIVIFGLSRFFTHPLNNINYVFGSPFFMNNLGEVYPFVWFAVAFVAIFVTNFLIVRMSEFNE